MIPGSRAAFGLRALQRRFSCAIHPPPCRTNHPFVSFVSFVSFVVQIYFRPAKSGLVQPCQAQSNLPRKKFTSPSAPRTPHSNSTLVPPNTTVALGCETLYWVATGLSRPQIAGLNASNPLEFKAFQLGQTEIKPRQTKKLNSGRVGLGCGILCFLHCLLFKARFRLPSAEKRSKLQNEPNFQIKPIKPKLNRFLKMQPYATLHLGRMP